MTSNSDRAFKSVKREKEGDFVNLNWIEIISLKLKAMVWFLRLFLELRTGFYVFDIEHVYSCSIGTNGYFKSYIFNLVK